MPDSRYRITERVAAGGMAEVFKGVAESLQGFKKNIAIKRILPSLTKNKKFVAMFLDEARLSLSLQHANIVQVFDIGHADDTYFIVMEFVDGCDLKALIEWRKRTGKRLPISHTLYIMMEVCKGISYAHDMVNPDTGKPLGIVHRDISPPNVLLSRNGEVKVVDFGLAKATSQLESTDPGVVKGKMSYLSPEAARGEDVDNRSDIFACGILLYELLTNKRLFYGETDYQTVELVRNAKIPPIGAQNPDVELELEDVVRKALARRLEDRFQTATDLQDALAHYLFSRGMKVLQRDIAELVRECVEDRMTQSGVQRKQQNQSLIDTLLQDEIVKFTSVGHDEVGAKPLGPGEISAPEPGAPEDHSGNFIDPRGWAEDLSVPLRATGAQMDAVPGSAAAASPATPRRTERVMLDASKPAPAPAGARLPPPGAASARMTPASPAPTVENAAGSIAEQAARARTTGRSMKAVTDPRNREPGLGGPTPGIETLAKVLEPTPAFGTAMKPAGKGGGGKLIAVVIGVLILGAAAAALALKLKLF